MAAKKRSSSNRNPRSSSRSSSNRNPERSSSSSNKSTAMKGSRNSSRSGSSHHFKRRNRSARRTHNRLEPDADLVVQQLDIFIEEMKKAEETGYESPPPSLQHDKSIVKYWGPIRGAAMFIKNRNVLVDTKEKIDYMEKLRNKYGFNGQLLLDGIRLSKETLRSLTAHAEEKDFNVITVCG